MRRGDGVRIERHQHKSYRHAPELKPSDEFARI
jgi:hypothetical protein